MRKSRKGYTAAMRTFNERVNSAADAHRLSVEARESGNLILAQSYQFIAWLDACTVRINREIIAIKYH